MPRSGKEARRRLQQAALELFQERGYEAATTAEIAARAGVTERTFFRHFPDKREVLFDGEEAFRDALAEGIRAAPEDFGPMDVLLWAFGSVEPMLHQNRALSELRQRVIARSPALQERVLMKTSGLTSALSAALHRRGIPADLATFAARVGMAVFSHAAAKWFDDPTVGLKVRLECSFAELRGLLPARCPG